MENEIMDIDQLAAYLERDAREVDKLANRGHLPGKKIGGQWRFASSEINYWIETQMHAYTEQELASLELRKSARCQVSEPLVLSMLTEATVAVNLHATTKASVLRDLVNLAEQSWQIYDTDALHSAIKNREELGSTAMAGGVAIPHPHRPLSDKFQGESVIAFARTSRPIPFGASDNGLTDIFFLVSCRSSITHLRVLARLSRMMLQPNFLDSLRAAETVAETLYVLEQTERDLIL